MLNIEETTKEWLEGRGVGGPAVHTATADALGVCQVADFGHECC